MTDQPPQKPLTVPLPANETERLAALHRYKILDTPPEAAFDRITRLAARLFDIPTALISLVDESRAWFKSCMGFDARDVPRNVTLCSFSVLTDEPLIIPDTRLDDRFACNPFVQGESGVRFYAGAPLLSHDGFNLGTLCLIDSQPRDPLTAEQQATLVDLAAMVVDELELRLAAQKIAQSEEKYRTLFESIDEGFCIVEVLFKADGRAYDHRILQANPAFERHAGILNPNGKTASELAPGIEQVWNDLYAQVVHTGESVRLENRSDALDRWFDVLVSRVGDASTRQVVVVFNDITKRKQTEAALQESESRLKLALNIAKLGSWQLDLKTNQLLTSEQCKANFGFSSDADFSHQALFARMHPDDRAWVTAAIQQAIEQHTDYDVEYRNVWDDGSIHWVMVRGCTFYEANGTPLQMSGMSLDITERKQAEAALRESEELKQRILESSNDCIKVLTLESEILYISQGGCCLLEIDDPTLVLNANWINFWQGEAQEQARTAIAAAKAGSMSQFQGNCPTLKGTPKWWDSVITPVRDAAGQVVQLVAISRDITLQKQAEDLLRDSEEMFRNMADHAPFMVWVTDPSGYCTYLSQSWYDFTGQTPESSLGFGWLDQTHPEDREAAEQVFLDANKQQKAFRLEYRLQRKDGEYSWAIDAATPWFGVDGQFKGYIGSVIDISDRKQAEAALRDSEEQIRNILESINDGFFALDEHWRFTYVNRAAEILLDRTSNDLMDQSIWEAYPGLNGSEFEQLYWRVMRDRLSGSLTSFYPDHDRWYEVHVYPAARGITIYFRNVTEQIQTAAAVQESKVRLDFALEAAQFGDWDLDLKDQTVTRSLKHDQIFGYESLLPKWTYNMFLSHVLPEDRAEVDRQYQIALANNTAWNQECRICRIDQQVRWIWVLGYIYIDAQGEAIRMVGLVSDITDRKTAEAERESLLQLEQAAREEADRANRIKDEFLAVLSHELRSPLNPILGWSKLLQKGNLDETRTQHALKTIERNANLQSELIEDLLDVSRILQGKLSLTVSSVNLAVVIRAAMETMRLAAEAKSIQVEACLNPEVGNVSGDATRLQQVIWNLLSNAVKFTPAGGRVTVQLEQVGNQAQITLSDTGKGIQPEFVPYVFDYFRQEDGATTRKFGGLGLGLAIVRHLVELHGGTVRAESPGEGQGATFVIRLPLMRAASKANQDKRPPENPVALNNINILVVDDETDSRELVAFLLEQQGAQVRTASSAHEALIVLTQSTPDILLSDIGMPEMDGYMLIQQVRTLAPEQGGQIPAIALTAYAGEMNQQQALAAGFQRHISKPIEPQRLIQTISSLIRSA